MSENRWWAVEGDPIFLANINGEETPSIVTFKDGIYQYLCPREGSPYTTAENIRRMKLVPLDDRTALLTKLRDEVEGFNLITVLRTFNWEEQHDLAGEDLLIRQKEMFLALLEKGGE